MNSTLSAYDRKRLAGLRKTRRRATGLLVMATLVFASTFLMGDATWVGFLRTTAEASMIGGIADWFAVVALFRHPLGIPIPHTAVIPKSKEGLGRGLGDFIRQNFLDPDVLMNRLDAASLPTKLGRWLTEADNAEFVAGHLANTVGAVAEGLDASAVEDELEQLVVGRLRALPMAELVGRGMEAAIANGQHQPVMTAAISGIAGAMEENRMALRQRLGQESPWWVPDAVDDAVFARAFEALRRFLEELAADPDHEIRHTIDARLNELSHRLRTDPAMARLVAERLDELTSHPEIRSWARETWSELTTSLSEAATRSDSGLRRRITTALTGFGHRLQHDQALTTRIDTLVQSIAPPVARTAQREIGELISSTIDRWDPDDTSRRLELWMGRDLQFVRINGTVVGGLAGLVIHTVVFVLGG